MSNGKQVYLAYRQRKEIFRSGEKNISEACDKGIACWGISYDTLLEMRRECISLIGVYVKDENEIYLTHYDNFFNGMKATVMNYDARGGSLQKYLPMQHWVKAGNAMAA